MTNKHMGQPTISTSSTKFHRRPCPTVVLSRAYVTPFTTFLFLAPSLSRTLATSFFRSISCCGSHPRAETHCRGAAD